jgi:hypothetical protein
MFAPVSMPHRLVASHTVPRHMPVAPIAVSFDKRRARYAPVLLPLTLKHIHRLLHDTDTSGEVL